MYKYYIVKLKYFIYNVIDNSASWLGDKSLFKSKNIMEFGKLII